MRASAAWHRIWRSYSTTPSYMPGGSPDRYGGVLSGADAVVFVPATAAAFRRRGFDHMEAIARSFCDLSGVSLLDALVKYGHGDQRELGRDERREHARGMYETVEDVHGCRLLLIDDVITTGATMAAARQSSSVPAPRQSMASLSYASGRGGFVAVKIARRDEPTSEQLASSVILTGTSRCA